MSALYCSSSLMLRLPPPRSFARFLARAPLRKLPHFPERWQRSALGRNMATDGGQVFGQSLPEDASTFIFLFQIGVAQALGAERFERKRNVRAPCQVSVRATVRTHAFPLAPFVVAIPMYMRIVPKMQKAKVLPHIGNTRHRTAGEHLSRKDVISMACPPMKPY